MIDRDFEKEMRRLSRQMWLYLGIILLVLLCLIVVWTSPAHSEQLYGGKYGPDGMTPNPNHGYTVEHPMPELDQVLPKGWRHPEDYPEFNKAHLPDLGDPRGKFQEQFVTDLDRALANKALQIVSSIPNERVEQPWLNTQSGNHGYYMVRPGTPKRVDGQPCRSLIMGIYAGGIFDQQDQLACRKQGKWVVVISQHVW